MFRPLLFIASLFIASLCAFAADAVTLRVARNELPATLGNPYAAAGQPGFGVWSAIFDGLTQIDIQGNVVPSLAQSWSLVNPTTWRFQLRPGVLFHNGRPLAARDVVAMIEYLQSPRGKRWYLATEAAGIASARAVSDGEVEIVTAKPDAILLKRLAALMIVDSDLWAADEDKFALMPVGTGAWRVIDWGRARGRAEFAAFGQGWRKASQITRLEIVPLPETTTRLAALKSGQVDIAEGMSPEDMDDLEGLPLIRATVRSTQVMAIALPNVDRPNSVLQDKRVRQALNYGVNRAAIAREILRDRSRIAAVGCSDVSFGCDPNLAPYPYDPERAKALLAEAGYPNGFAITADVVTGFGESDQLIYQQVAADLTKIGVRLTVRAVPYPTWLQRYLQNQWGDADAFSLAWDSSAYADAIRALKYYSCEKSNPFFCAPELMPALEASDQIMDVEQRRQALYNINLTIKDLAPSLWLVEQPFHYAYTDAIETFKTRPYGVLYEQITFMPGAR